MSTLLIISAIVAVLAAPVAAFFCGVKRGRQLGHEASKAIGWLEHHEQEAEKQRARRDARGRFRSRLGRGNEVGA